MSKHRTVFPHERALPRTPLDPCHPNLPGEVFAFPADNLFGQSCLSFLKTRRFIGRC